MKPPIEMPASGAALQEFEPQRVDYAAPEAGGRVGGVQAGFPLWLAVWTIGRVGADKSDEWRAWLLRMRGSTRRFLGRDLSRPYPKAHIGGFAHMTKADGAPFLGAASDWSETITGEDDSEVTLEGVPPGLILSAGDYIGFKWDGAGSAAGSFDRRALVRVVEGAMADSAGDIIVTSEPPIPSLVPAGAIAHLDRPACIMVLITEQSKLEAMDRRLAVRGGTIAGVQDLRA